MCMTTYSDAILPIFGAKKYSLMLPQTDCYVITECSIMHKGCSFFGIVQFFEYDKFRPQFLIKHALSTLCVQYLGLHMHEGCFMLEL
jgi:hypothetical protein